MSLHMAIVAFKGDHISHAGELFNLFDYRVLDSGTSVRNLGDAEPRFQWPIPGRPRSHVCKAATSHQGWTVIFDPEMVMPADSDCCEQAAATLGTEVVAALCEGTSGSYGYWVYGAGRRRGLLSVGEHVAEDTGAALPEESGIRKGSPTEDDVVLLLQRFGIDYGALTCAESWTVYEMDSGEDTQRTPQPGKPAPAKPWWRIW